jgi:hypothetical protein
MCNEQRATQEKKPRSEVNVQVSASEPCDPFPASVLTHSAEHAVRVRDRKHHHQHDRKQRKQHEDEEGRFAQSPHRECRRNDLDASALGIDAWTSGGFVSRAISHPSVLRHGSGGVTDWRQSGPTHQCLSSAFMVRAGQHSPDTRRGHTVTMASRERATTSISASERPPARVCDVAVSCQAVSNLDG